MQLNITEAEQAATEGLTRSVEKADRDYSGWSERCWQLFLKWLSKKQVGFHFQVEEFRSDLMAWNKIEEPNSNRAFGFISKRALNQRLIVSAGKAKTKSKTSHSANAEVWRKI
jgi:hypothetical protein